MEEARAARGTQTVFFRPRFQARCRPRCGLIDPIPLINVILLALLFFAVMPLMLSRPGLAIDLPEAPFRDGVPFDAVAIAVTGDGRFFFDDAPLAPDALGEALARAVSVEGRTVLLIEADRQAPYERIVEVHNRALEAGMRKVAIATRPPLSPARRP